MGDGKRRLLRRRAPGAPPALSAFSLNVRPFADRMFQFALSELSLVVLLGVAWINPGFVESIRPGFVASLPVLFVAEFILGHASVGLTVTVLFEGMLRWAFVLFLVFLYAGFFYALFLFGHAVQVAFFLWITVARLYRAETSLRESGHGRENRERLLTRLAVPSALRFFFLMACLFLSIVLPLPPFGLAGYSGPTLGSGEFVDHPERVIFLLMLYFTTIPWIERNVTPKVTRLFVR